MSNEIEAIIRRIVREEIRAAGFILHSDNGPNPVGLYRTNKSIIGQRQAILNLLELYPKGLTSREIADLMYRADFGSPNDFYRSIIQATHLLKKQQQLVGDMLGKRCFRFRLRQRRLDRSDGLGDAHENPAQP